MLRIHRSLLFNHLGKPLYSQASEFDEKQFGDIMRRILLPMALDYHVRSREIDINELAADQLSDLNGNEEEKNAAITVRMVFCLFVCLFVFDLYTLKGSM